MASPFRYTFFINTHLRILGWLYVIMGGISLIASAYFGYAIFQAGPATFAPEVQRILVDSGYGTVVLGILVIASLGTCITGLAFLYSHPAARTLGYIFAVLGLLDFPLGTAPGIYTFWVLGHTVLRKEDAEKVLG